MVAPNGHVRSLATLLELSEAPANDPQGCSGLLPGIEVPSCFLQDVSEPRVAIARIADLLKQAPGRKMEIGTLQGLVPPKHWRSVDQLRKCEGFERKTYTPKGSKNGSGGEFLKLRNFQPHSSWRQGLVSVNRSSAAALCRLSSAAAALLWPQHTSNNRHYLAVSICAVLVHNWSARQQEERYALPAVAWLELKQLQPLLRKQCKADQRLSQILSGARNVEKLQSQMTSLLGAEEFGPWLTVEERQDSVFVMYAVSATVQLLCRSVCAIINLPEGWKASDSAMHAPSDGFFLPDFMGDDVLSCTQETAVPFHLGSEDRGRAAAHAGQQKGGDLGARMTLQHGVHNDGSGSSQLQGGCTATAQLPAADCSASGGYFEQLLGGSPLESSPAPFVSSLFSSTSMLAAAAPSVQAAHAFRSPAQPVGMQLPQPALFPAGDAYDPVTGSPPLSATQFPAAPSPLVAAAGSPAAMSLFAVGSPGGLSCPAEIQACWHSKKPKPHPSNLSRCTAGGRQCADEMPGGAVGEGLMSKEGESIPIITGFSPRVQGEEAHGGKTCNGPVDDAPPSPATMSLLSSTPWSHTPVLELGGKQLPCKLSDRALRPLQQQLPVRALADAGEPFLAHPHRTWGSAGVRSLSQKAVASEAALAAKSDSTSQNRGVAAKTRKLLAEGMRAAAAGPDKGDAVCRPAAPEAALAQEGVRASASAGAQSLPEMRAPCGWRADAAPAAYASASNLALGHAGTSSASSCASADSGPAVLPGQPPLSGYAAALKHSSSPQPGAKAPVAAAVPADGVEGGVQHEAAGSRDSMTGHGLSGSGDAHRAGVAEDAKARGFEERPPDSCAAAGQASGMGTREGGGAALDGVSSGSRRAAVGQDAAASGQPQPAMPAEKGGKGTGRHARRSDGGEAAQPQPAAQLAAGGQEAALAPMAAAGLQSAVAGCEEAAGIDGDAPCPQQPGAAPAAPPGVSYAAAALRGRAAADTPSPAGAPAAVPSTCLQPGADLAKAPKAATDATGTGSASGSDSNSSPEGASSNGWHAVSQVTDGERDALAKHLDERSQAVLQRLSSQQAMHVLSRVVLQQKRIVSRGDMVQNINKLFMAFAKDFVPPARSGLCTTSPSPSQTLAGSGSSPGGKKPGGSCQAEVAKELTGIKWEAVRQEVASLIVNHSEFLKVEHWDDGVLFWLNHRGSEDEALEALRWIVQRHDFGRASNMPAYLTHWLKACGSQSSSVPASSNGAVAASGSLAASDCKSGMPVAVHRLPKRVQGVLETMVASCGALSWSHFDAGVMKVLVSLCEKSVDDALDELTALEDSDLASIEKMPAYLNKCLNNRLWSLHKGAA